MNIETATKQEIFDAAVRGLASQGWQRSMSRDGRCMYRGAFGRRCAVGWCIDEDEYNPEMEGSSVSDFFDVTECLRVRFLDTVQNAHDCHAKTQDMLSEFIAVSQRFKLTWPADVEQAI